MATEKQILANRRNSQHSTGPRTEAGKAASAANALKTGIYAESLVIRGEDAEELAELAANYAASFQPANAVECDLVDTMVRGQWKIWRLEAIEADLWEQRFHSQDAGCEHPLAEAFHGLDAVLARIQRSIHAYERSIARALKQLQRRVGVPACPPAEGRQPMADTTPVPKIGFVPSSSPLIRNFNGDSGINRHDSGCGADAGPGAPARREAGDYQSEVPE